MTVRIAIIAAIATLATTADANPNVFCTQRTGFGDYACYPVYAGLSYPTGANTQFRDHSGLSMKLSGWYAAGCSATPVFSMQLEPYGYTEHFALDPFQNRNVVYTWCAPDGTPDIWCSGGQARPWCR